MAWACLNWLCPHEIKTSIREKHKKIYLKYKNLELNSIQPIIDDYLLTRVVKEESYSKCFEIHNKFTRCINRRIEFSEKYIHPECNDEAHKSRINLLIYMRNLYITHMGTINEISETKEEKKEEPHDDEYIEITVPEICPSTCNEDNVVEMIQEIDPFIEINEIKLQSFTRGLVLVQGVSKTYLSRFVKESRMEDIPPNLLAAILTVAFRAGMMGILEEESIAYKDVLVWGGQVDLTAIMADFDCFEQGLTIFKGLALTNKESRDEDHTIDFSNWDPTFTSIEQHINEQEIQNWERNTIKVINNPTKYAGIIRSRKSEHLDYSRKDTFEGSISWIGDVIINSKLMKNQEIGEIVREFSRSFIVTGLNVDHLIYNNNYPKYDNVCLYAIQNLLFNTPFDHTTLTIPSPFNVLFKSMNDLANLKFKSLEILKPPPPMEFRADNVKFRSICKFLPVEIYSIISENDDVFNDAVPQSRLSVLFGKLINLNNSFRTVNDLIVDLLTNRAAIQIIYWFESKKIPLVFDKKVGVYLNMALKFTNKAINTELIRADFTDFTKHYHPKFFNALNIPPQFDINPANIQEIYIFLNNNGFMDAHVLRLPSPALEKLSQIKKIPLPSSYQEIPISECSLPNVSLIKSYLLLGIYIHRAEYKKSKRVVKNFS